MAGYFDEFIEQDKPKAGGGFFDEFVEAPSSSRVAQGDDRSWGEAAKDFTDDIRNVVYGLAKSGISLVDPESGAARKLGDVMQEAELNQTPYRRALRTQLAESVERAKARGDTGAMAWAEHMADNPVTAFLPEVIGNVAPFMATGGVGGLVGTGIATARGASAAGAAAAGSRGALAATSGLGATVGAGGTRQGYYDKIMSLNEQELAEQSPEYVQLRQGGLGHDEAKSKLATQVDAQLAGSMAASGGVGFVTGRLGAEAAVFGKGGGVLKTGLVESGTEAIEGATQQLAQNIGIQSVLPAQPLTEDVFLSAVQEAAVGGVGGAAAGIGAKGRQIQTGIPGAPEETFPDLAAAQSVDEVIAVTEQALAVDLGDGPDTVDFSTEEDFDAVLGADTDAGGVDVLPSVEPDVGLPDADVQSGDERPPAADGAAPGEPAGRDFDEALDEAQGGEIGRVPSGAPTAVGQADLEEGLGAQEPAADPADVPGPEGQSRAPAAAEAGDRAADATLASVSDEDLEGLALAVRNEKTGHPVLDELPPPMRSVVIDGERARRRGDPAFLRAEATAAVENDRRNLDFREVTKRTPELQSAIEKVRAGEMTAAEYGTIVNRVKPVAPYTAAPDPTPEPAIRAALTSDKVDKIGVPRQTLKKGSPVGLRLDIPAYSNHGAWVVSVHEQGAGFAAGKAIGYESVAAVTKPTFGVVEKAAMNIAGGKPKATIAVIKGDWNPVTPQAAKLRAQQALKDPSWTQVGMDPERHAYFYDRTSMKPVVSADEVIQVGPLVLAKNPVYGNEADFAFARSPTGERDKSGKYTKQSMDYRVARVKHHVDQLTEGWKNKPEITILETIDDAPPHVAKAAKLGQAPMGFILGDNQVYIVADQVSTATQVRRVVFHEGIGHAGLRGFFGKDLQPVLDMVKRERAPAVATALRAGAPNEDIAAEEVLVALAETRPESSIVKRAVAIMRGLLRKMGIGLKMSNNDIVNDIIIPARRWIEEGGRTRTDGADAKSPAFKRSDEIAEIEKEAAKFGATPEQIEGLVDHRMAAIRAKPDFDAGVRAIAKAVGGKAILPKIKGVERSVEKMMLDYNGDASRLKDVVRATVELDSIRFADDAVKAARKAFGDLVGLRNHLHPDDAPVTPDGYRDIKMNVVIDGHMAELQINVPQMLVAKDEAHVLYETTRKLRGDIGDRDPTAVEAGLLTRLDEQQKEIYDAAWTSALNAASEIRDPFLEKESKGNRRPSGTSQARTTQSGVADTGTPSTSANRVPGGNDSGNMDAPTSIVPAFKRVNGKDDDAVGARLAKSAKAGFTPLTERGGIDLSHVRQDPKLFAKQLATVTGYSGSPPTDGMTDDQKASAVLRHMTDNLLWIYDQVPAEIRERSKLWYVGAERISRQMAQRYGVAHRQMAGAMASLSPQRDWYQNVSLAERIADINFNYRDHPWDDRFDAAAQSLHKPIDDDKKTTPEKKAEKHAALDARLNAIRGKTYAEVAANDPKYLLRAQYVRVFDRAVNSPNFRIITPEGAFGKVVHNDDKVSKTGKVTKGKPANIGWGSNSQIANAIAMLENNDLQVISDRIGSEHKVRNFYNNILNPEDADFSTIDTHAVAALWLQPFGGSDKVVSHNLGSAASSDVLGVSGTYAWGQEAHQAAAKERGVLAREMQSITWEAVRGLFTNKSVPQKAIIDGIWREFSDGNITIETARSRVLEAAGGIDTPTWNDGSGVALPGTIEGQPSDSGGDGGERGLSYERRVPVAGAPAGRGAGPVSSGAGSEAAGSVPAFARQPFVVADPGNKDNYIRKLQDKFIDVKRTVQAITAAGNQIADKWNVYLQEELYHGRTAQATKSFLEKELRPFLQDMAMRKVDMGDFEEFLHARHAEERNVQIAKVNPKMQDGGSGMKTADARAYLAALTPDQRQNYDALAKRIDAINKSTRALLVKSGLEKASTINAWDGAYSSYVPLQRDLEQDYASPGTGQGFSVRGSSTRRAMGSNKPVIDIIANIAMQREKTIVRAEKNRVAQALWGLAAMNPNPDLWSAIHPKFPRQRLLQTLTDLGISPADAVGITDFPKVRSINKTTGLVEERTNTLLMALPNVVTMRVGGEDRYVVMNTKSERGVRMAGAVKNLDAARLEGLLAASSVVTKWLASVNTQFNPVFGIVNFTRDVQGALVNLSSTPIAGKQAQVAKNLMGALRIYSDIRKLRKGQQPTGPWAALFEEFKREGGQTGFRNMFTDSTERMKDLRSELELAAGGGKLKRTLLAGPVFDWLSDYNDWLENATRLAVYKTGKDNGLTNQQAASVAKNISVNFNRKGEVALQTGALYAFFNAAMQGTARLYETLRGPAGAKILWGGVLLGSAQAVLLAAAGFKDDEPPEFVKERNMIIPIGGGRYVTIPMPLGLHVLPNLGRHMTEFIMNGGKEPEKRIASLVAVMADAFNPIGNAGLSLQTIAPSALDPIVALKENRDWTGKPIAREDFSGLNPTPGHTRAKDTSSWPAVALSKALNRLTGGTEYKPGVVSPSPDQLDYLVGQATGGVGREVLKSMATGKALRTGEDLPPYKVPLVGRFYGNVTGQAAQGARFYENLKKLNAHELEIKGRKEDRGDVSGYLRENPQARLVDRANRAQRDVSKARKEKRYLVEKGAPPEMIKRIDERITRIMTDLNDQLEKLED